MADPHTLAALAEAVADGTPIDWDAAESAAASESDRAAIQRLRQIARIAGRSRRPARFSWGHLDVIEKIGEGAFAEVFRAHDPKLALDVALKLMREPESRDEQRASALIEEGRLLARVRHPNVVSVYGADRIDGRVGIWTELVDGQTLDAIVRERGPLPVADVVDIGVQLSRALAAVHNAGTLHRDVKASNVMREAGGRVVLMDFGTGLDLDREPMAGDVAGTPLYLAPEIFDGGTQTRASDVYALSVLLFQLLTGRYPVEGRTYGELRERHRSTAMPIAGVREVASPAVARMIERGLARDPAQRPPAREIEAALDTTHTPQRWLVPVMVAASIALIAWWAVAARPSVTGAPGEPQVVCADCGHDRASLSADGRYLVAPRNPGFIVHDLERQTAESMRPVGGGSEKLLLVGEPAISRGGRFVACLWTVRAGGPAQLAVIDRKSHPDKATRILFGTDTKVVRNVHSWSANDAAVLISFVDGQDPRWHLAWVPASGEGPVRIVKSYDPRTDEIAGPVRPSPDGRYLAYAARRRVEGDDKVPTRAVHRSLYLLPADGGNEELLVGNAASNTDPVWSADGTHVFYTSDESGTFDLWSIGVRSGRQVGERRLLKQNLGRQRALGVLADGSYRFLRSEGGQNQVFIADLTATGEGGVARPASSFGTAPKWSPNGTLVAFIRQMSTTGAYDLVVRDARGQETVVFSDLKLRGPLLWYGDSRRVLLQLQSDSSYQLVELDLVTTKRTLRTAPGVQRLPVAALSPDGSTLYSPMRATKDGPAGMTHIGATDLTSGETRRIWSFAPTRPRGGEVGLALNAEGTKLAVTTIVEGAIHVFVIGVDGRGHRTVGDPYPNQQFANKVGWAGNSVVIGLTSPPASGGQRWQILALPFDMPGPARVLLSLNGPGNNGSFDVTSDGRSLAFHPDPNVPQSFSATSVRRIGVWQLDVVTLLRQPR